MNTPASFNQNEWQARQVFISRITALCHQESISLSWLSDSWVARLEKHGRAVYLYAYRFPLNNAVASAIATDKVATYEVLKYNHIPAVPHTLVRITDEEPSIETTRLPCVAKPCSQGGGKDVYKATSLAELSAIIEKMKLRYPEIALSPFEDITGEYRVVVFDESVPLIFQKIPTEGEWRHNLAFNATAEPVEDGALYTALATLGKQAAAALGLRFVAVDCITTKQGMKVLEVNAGFSLNKIDDRFDETVNCIYRDALRACFQGAA